MVNYDHTRSFRIRQRTRTARGRPTQRRWLRMLPRRRRNTTRSQHPKAQQKQAKEYDFFHSLFFPYYRKKDAPKISLRILPGLPSKIFPKSVLFRIRQRRLKIEILPRIIITDIPHDFPDPFHIVWQLPIRHLLTEQIAKDSPEILMPGK